jgi:hypothetical protein
MEKWEYKTIQTDPRADGTLETGNFNMMLNQQGNNGWELVSCFTSADAGEVITVFKRKAGGSSTSFEDKPSGARTRSSAYSGKKFHSRGEEFPAWGEKPRSYGDKPRAYGKNTAYKEKGAGSKEKGPGYAGKEFGYPGKNSGYDGKSAGSRKGPGSGKGQKSKAKSR